MNVIVPPHPTTNPLCCGLPVPWCPWSSRGWKLGLRWTYHISFIFYHAIYSWLCWWFPAYPIHHSLYYYYTCYIIYIYTYVYWPFGITNGMQAAAVLTPATLIERNATCWINKAWSLGRRLSTGKWGSGRFCLESWLGHFASQRRRFLDFKCADCCFVLGPSYVVRLKRVQWLCTVQQPRVTVASTASFHCGT